MTETCRCAQPSSRLLTLSTEGPVFQAASLLDVGVGTVGNMKSRDRVKVNDVAKTSSRMLKHY